ncbi:hypothetical protein MPH_04336 [Macrophomina phaseolina MS6]|uniref:Uncharacterized protein n=1 Tax=Macrophomina phaseolina (strain MS6) TaxID=1126212 RepID=K2S829_MACPH|nr:hypothetical protein MPH_04336 [Macrophomina phaseolina MS6]
MANVRASITNLLSWSPEGEKSNPTARTWGEIFSLESITKKKKKRENKMPNADGKDPTFSNLARTDIEYTPLRARTRSTTTNGKRLKPLMSMMTKRRLKSSKGIIYEVGKKERINDKLARTQEQDPPCNR